MSGEEHAGYLDIKLPQKSRYRRTRVWCNRWVVLHKVSDLSVARMLAKLGIYAHAEHASSPEKKISSILLENVTSIKSISTSRTHPHAFEICEAGNPILLFSAATVTETRLWACFLREIFNLNSLDTAGLYCVWIRENDYSDRLGLTGDYLMTITSTHISISKANGQGCFQWPLLSLKKFYTRPIVPEAKHNHILIIEPNESLVIYGNFVMFVTPRAEEIVMRLRTNIFMNTKVKSRNRTIPTNRSAPQYNRYNSLPQGLDPETISLYNFQSFSTDRERAISVFEPHDYEFQEVLNRDISITVPPPKPARNRMHTTTSDTPPSWDENKETTEDSPAEEFAVRKSNSQRSCLEAKQCDCDLDPQLEPVTPCQGDEVNDQKFKNSLPNNLGSRDSGVLSFTSETGSVDLRQQTARSNSGDSAISLLSERQKTIPQTNEPILEKFATLECSSKSSESDKESDDHYGGHIYWDIEPQELDIPQTEILPRKMSISLSRCHSLQNLLPSDANDYEDLEDLKKGQKEMKNAPPALPKRPKSLAFSKDKAFLKSSMKERFLGSFSNLSPRIKRQTQNNKKADNGADDLNKVIKDFRKWTLKEKSAKFSETRRVCSESERTTAQNTEFPSCQKRKIQHSWSTSDASNLSWNDEETKDGVFVVERKVDPLYFLKRDPFRLLSNRHIVRQGSFDVGHSTIDGENDDLSPILNPVVVHSPKQARDFGTGHWSDGDTKGNDGDFDDEFPPNRRRSISLEARLEYQVMIRQLKKDLRETPEEQPLTNPGPSPLHTTHEMPVLSNSPTFPTNTAVLSNSPTFPTNTAVSSNSSKLKKAIFADYIEMSDRTRSSSVCVLPSQLTTVDQKRKATEMNGITNSQQPLMNQPIIQIDNGWRAAYAGSAADANSETTKKTTKQQNNHHSDGLEVTSDESARLHHSKGQRVACCTCRKRGQREIGFI